jgi:hypothetical protein
LRCAALLAGVAVSFKITAALFPLALAGLTLLAVFIDTHADRYVTRIAAVSAATWEFFPLTLLPVVPWCIRSLLVTGNPFFPLLVTLIPSRDLSPASAAAFDQFFRYWNWGSSLGTAWTLERRRLLLVATAALLVTVAAFVFTRLRSSLARGLVLAMAAVVLTQLYAVGLYTRLWIPLAAVLMLPVTASVGWALSGRLMAAVLIVAALAASGLHARREVGAVSCGIRCLVRTAVGLEDRREFLLHEIPLFPIYEYANRQLPSGARILLTHSCMGFYLDRSTYCGETIQDSVHWTVRDEFVGDLRRLGVTHVIAPRIFAEGSAPPPVARTSLMFLHDERERELLRELLGRHARVLTTAADQALYALDSDMTKVASRVGESVEDAVAGEARSCPTPPRMQAR